MKSAWKNATTIGKLKAFITNYSNSPYISQAKSKIKNLEEIRERNKLYSLTVNRTPSNAHVTILDVKPSYDHSHNRVMLKRGIYKIQVSRRGYITSDPITVKIPRDKSINVHLEKIDVPPPIHRYSLNINTVPADAHVNYFSGSSFSNGSRLESGTYNFTISRRGYLSKTIGIYLNKSMSKTVYLTKKKVDPPPQSKCSEQLKKVQSYVNQNKEVEAILQLSEFNLNARNCTQAERNRAKKFKF